MRQEAKVLIEMAAKKRTEGLLRSRPSVRTALELDESGLRGVLQVFDAEDLEHIEFFETVSTAGQVRYFDDYVEVAKSTGKLVLIFPESKYSRDMASAVFSGILKDVRSKAGRDVEFQGFVFDDLGNIKKVS